MQGSKPLNKKICGFVLCGYDTPVSQSAADGAMLCDFAHKSLIDVNIMDVKVLANIGPEPFSLIKQKLNESNADFAIALKAECFVGKAGLKSAVQYCHAQNGSAKLVAEDGSVIGYILDCDCKPVSEVTVNGESITALNFAQISSERKSHRYTQLINQGVFLESADGAIISPLAEIGKGTYISDNCFISGKSVIGENCKLVGAHIENSVIGSSVSVINSRVLDSSIQDCTRVGPFSYIRPGCKVGSNVKVGDFVELKNSVIGNNTSISHLTYIGDSDVGQKVNFGCGTVTVNYDGVKKHRTQIGDYSFIGCNTNIISPVSIGKNVYIAAGSTITDDMPDRAFAIARQRQTTKNDYVTNKMPQMIKGE